MADILCFFHKLYNPLFNSQRKINKCPIKPIYSSKAVPLQLEIPKRYNKEEETTEIDGQTAEWRKKGDDEKLEETPLCSA